jgi:hypothetical protein
MQSFMQHDRGDPTGRRIAAASAGRPPAWWSRRWSAGVAYHEYLRRSFEVLMGGRRRAAADEPQADDVIVLTDEDVCEVVDEAEARA